MKKNFLKKSLSVLLSASMMIGFFTMGAAADSSVLQVKNLGISDSTGQLSVQWTYDGALTDDNIYDYLVKLVSSNGDYYYTSYSTRVGYDNKVSFDLYDPDLIDVVSVSVAIEDESYGGYESEDAYFTEYAETISCSITYDDTYMEEETLTISATSDQSSSGSTLYQSFKVEGFLPTKYTTISNNKGSSSGSYSPYGTDNFVFEDKYYDSDEYWRYGFGGSSTGTFVDSDNVGTKIIQYTYAVSDLTYTIYREIYQDFYVNKGEYSSSDSGGAGDSDTEQEPTIPSIDTISTQIEDGNFLVKWDTPASVDSEVYKANVTLYSTTGASICSKNSTDNLNSSNPIYWKTNLADTDCTVGSIVVELYDTDSNLIATGEKTVSFGLSFVDETGFTVDLNYIGDNSEGYAEYEYDFGQYSFAVGTFGTSDDCISFTETGSNRIDYTNYINESASYAIASIEIDGSANITVRKIGVDVNFNLLDPQTVTWSSDSDISATYGEATVAGNTATSEQGGTISYSSSDENVVTVNSAGALTIVGAGSATITATAAEITDEYAETSITYDVTVVEQPVYDDDDDDDDDDDNDGGTSGTGSSNNNSDDDEVVEGTATVEVTSKTSNGTTTASIDTETITAAITALEESEETSTTLEIAVSTGSTATAVEVTLESGILEAYTESSVENLVITSDIGIMEISQEVVQSILAQADGEEITIAIDKVDTSSTLNDLQLAVVGDAPVYDLSVKAGDNHISSFDGASITISLPYELKDAESADGVVIWYIDEDGNIEKIYATYDEDTGLAAFQTTHFSFYVVAYQVSLTWDNPFADVTTSAWYYDYIYEIVEAGLMNGTSDNTFEPESTTTRAMIVTILYRLAGAVPVNYLMTFEDIESGSYYEEAVRWAASNGIVSGYTDEKFAPEDSITREQLATILYNYAVFTGLDVSVGENTNILSYTDALEISDYAFSPLQWANGAGIIGGNTDGSLNPQRNATRAESATMLVRFLSIAE